jgi:hypothetical protein
MTGRAQDRSLVPRLTTLAADQEQVLTRRQLAGLGISRWAVNDHLRAQRWREICPGVLVLHRGPITPPAARWTAVLAGGDCAALGAWTALSVYGLIGWERDAVHLVVPRGRHVPSLGDVVVHESRRHAHQDVRRLHGLPIHGVERAAVDAAGRVCHRRAMAAALLDVHGGAMALSEIDLARLCRSAGLPEPRRQRVRRNASGRRRYLDGLTGSGLTGSGRTGSGRTGSGRTGSGRTGWPGVSAGGPRVGPWLTSSGGLPRCNAVRSR